MAIETLPPAVSELVKLQLREAKDVNDTFYFNLQKGNKFLLLIIDIEDNWAVTWIETLKGNQKEPGSTTDLYQVALRIMEETARILQKPIRYQAVTSNERMKAWVRDPNKGNGIFNWDLIEEENEEGRISRLVATKTIYPTSNY